VGAGDSFLGGMVWSLVSGHGLENAFHYANAAGSAAVLAPGTELCRPDNIKRLYGQVINACDLGEPSSSPMRFQATIAPTLADTVDQRKYASDAYRRIMRWLLK
jgi:bifunctional ADP-heptose synthase (sugar kinase/adenylyltransferase)